MIHKTMLRRIANFAVFVSGSFNLFNVMCKQRHRTILNLILNGTKKVTVAVRFNEALSTCIVAPLFCGQLMCVVL